MTKKKNENFLLTLLLLPNSIKPSSHTHVKIHSFKHYISIVVQKVPKKNRISQIGAPVTMVELAYCALSIGPRSQTPGGNVTSSFLQLRFVRSRKRRNLCFSTALRPSLADQKNFFSCICRDW